MPKKPFIILEYKYPDQPWREYDRTQVLRWAEVQELRMIREHPNATYRRGKK